MIDPDCFIEPRVILSRIQAWAYDQEMLEIRNHQLQITDKAVGYLAFVLFFVGFFFLA